MRFFLFSLLFLLSATMLTGCGQKAEERVVEINDVDIKIEIVNTQEARHNGLSNREELCEDCGMLFEFDDNKIRSFVMREMNFPIDIIWINDKMIVGIDKNLQPEGSDYKNVYKSPEPVDYVLEVNAGFTDKNVISIGDKAVIK